MHDVHIICTGPQGGASFAGGVTAFRLRKTSGTPAMAGGPAISSMPRQNHAHSAAGSISPQLYIPTLSYIGIIYIYIGNTVKKYNQFMPQ